MLKGEKILLRPMKQDDILQQHKFDQDLELYLLDSSMPWVAAVESAQVFYESRVKHNDDLVGFAIEADGKYIGSCELWGLKDRFGNFELGIQIGDREYWGQGYGREAIHLLLEYGFRYLGGRRIVLTTNAKNERAIRCFTSVGFIEEGRPRKAIWLEGEFTDLVNMSILYQEWGTGD